jgi:3-hydroxyisobutyrate dehydrogenase
MPTINVSDTIGFIGLGVMGSSMANRLLAAGFKVRVHTRTVSKAQATIDAGGVWIPDLKDLASGCRAIITMLGYPDEVEAVYFGPSGLLTGAAPGTLLIDMTTSRPALARRIYDEGVRRRLQVLDAPVSGGDIGAREGRLSIMVGGDSQAFEDARMLFSALGARIVLQGGAGCGQRVKLCNQIAVFGNTLGTCEAMAFAVRAGLDPVKVLESIGAGAASSWALTNLAPRILNADFAPGFFVRHFLKDIGLALEEAQALGLEAPALKLASQLYGKLVKEGFGDRGTQALYQLLSQLLSAPPASGLSVPQEAGAST